MESTSAGLSHEETRVRLAEVGANALRSHGARPLAVLVRQLILLVAAALTSFAVGERTSALIILLIICLNVGLGFFNEYRSELAVEALHSQLRHTGLAVRDREPVPVDVTELVPGDVVRLAVGDVVPADLRLLRAAGLECDEAVLTGESLSAEKRSDPSRRRSPPWISPRARSWAPSCAKGAGWASSCAPAVGRSSARSRCSSENDSRRPPSSSACATSRCCSSG